MLQSFSEYGRFVVIFFVLVMRYCVPNADSIPDGSFRSDSLGPDGLKSYR